MRCERFFFFSLLVYFSDLRKSDRRNSSGKERKVLYATRATRGYQNHRISQIIQVKIRKILNFWLFSDLRRSNGQKFFGPKLKLLYAWVPKSWDFDGFPCEIVNTYKIVNMYEYV